MDEPESIRQEFEGLTTSRLEKERDRLYDLSREVAANLSRVKAELMRRALIDHVGGDYEDRS